MNNQKNQYKNDCELQPLLNQNSNNNGKRSVLQSQLKKLNIFEKQKRSKKLKKVNFTKIKKYKKICFND